MDRGNHYEAALEAYFQWHRLGYVGVDETRRARIGESQVKSLDFIVFGQKGSGLLVDVKGRRFPSGSPQRPRKVWENWSTQEDIDGLNRWSEYFGDGYQALLVFAYHVLPEVVLPDSIEDLWIWRGRRYLLRAIPVEDYGLHLKVRSPRWGTVDIPSIIFRRLVRPLRYFTHPQWIARTECPF